MSLHGQNELSIDQIAHSIERSVSEWLLPCVLWKNEGTLRYYYIINESFILASKSLYLSNMDMRLFFKGQQYKSVSKATDDVADSLYLQSEQTFLRFTTFLAVYIFEILLETRRVIFYIFVVRFQ